MAMKTAWFDGDVKPARPGVYERRFDSLGVVFALWTDGRWMAAALSAREAWDEPMAPSLSQARPWRGLAEPAQEAP